MPPLPSTSRPRAILVALALLTSLATALVASPVDAHGTKWNTAAHAGATRFDVYITAYDLVQDGHCARGRLHFGGRWRLLATDCSHSPVGNGVGSGYYAASGSISAASCLSGHSYGSSTCHYGTYTAPFGNIDLGNVP